MKAYLSELDRIKKKIDNSDKIIIGLGAGMSASGGLDYSNEEIFKRWYPEYHSLGFKTIWELISRYWVTDIKNLSTDEAKLYWGFWCRHIYHMRYEVQVTEPYALLRDLVSDKKKFVITTNGDHQSQKAFGDDIVFSPQGDYGYFQTTSGRGPLIDNRDMVMNMIANMESQFEIREEDIPYSSIYKQRLEPNLRCDDEFNNADWMDRYKDYESEIYRDKDANILFLEIGVGFNTPSIIRHPFESMTGNLKNAHLVRINMSDAFAPDEIKQKSTVIEDDILEVLKQLKK